MPTMVRRSHDSKTHTLIRRARGGLAALLVCACSAPGVAAELDDFFKGIESCDIPDRQSPLMAFAGSLHERYGNRAEAPSGYTADRTDVPLALPPDVASAFGPATSRNLGDYTALTLPVTGTFGGLPLKEMVVHMGNQNPIRTLTLVFSARRSDVEAVFGDSIEDGDEKGQDAGMTGDGYSAIIPQGEPGRIICDWSS